MQHSQMNEGDLRITGDAVKALGSLFKLTQVFLWGNDLSRMQKKPSFPQHIRFTYDSSDGDEPIISNITSAEFTDDAELTSQMNALGLPLSFNTSKEKSSDSIKGKRKCPRMTSIHDCESEVLDLSRLSEEIAPSLNFNDKNKKFPSFKAKFDSVECNGESGVWRAYWDSYYMRNYFFNIETLESTWYPPPDLEHLALNDGVNESCEVMMGKFESLENGAENLSSGQTCYEILACTEHSDADYMSNVNISTAINKFHHSCTTQNINKRNGEEIDSHEIKLKDHNWERDLQISSLSSIQGDNCFGNLEQIQGIELNFKLDKNLDDDDSRIVDVVASEDDMNGNVDIDWTCVSYKLASSQKKKKKKKRARNKSSSDDKGHLFEEVWEEFSCSVRKYWHQRYLLFSKFDDGIKMDEEGWYSVTPERIARHHAIRCGCGIIIDCFSGVGGNAIQFAERCEHVVAVDIDPMRIDYARHNASVYGVHDQIDFINGDFFRLATKLKGDTVFLSPPWGGPDYARLKRYDIDMLMPHHGRFLFDTAKQISSKIVMFLPKNVDVNQLAELCLSSTPPWSLEVEKNFLNGKLKAITAYFTDQTNF